MRNVLILAVIFCGFISVICVQAQQVDENHALRNLSKFPAADYDIFIHMRPKKILNSQAAGRIFRFGNGQETPEILYIFYSIIDTAQEEVDEVTAGFIEGFEFNTLEGLSNSLSVGTASSTMEALKYKFQLKFREYELEQQILDGNPLILIRDNGIAIANLYKADEFYSGAEYLVLASQSLEEGNKPYLKTKESQPFVRAFQVIGNADYAVVTTNTQILTGFLEPILAQSVEQNIADNLLSLFENISWMSISANVSDVFEISAVLGSHDQASLNSLYTLLGVFEIETKKAFSAYAKNTGTVLYQINRTLESLDIKLDGEAIRISLSIDPEAYLGSTGIEEDIENSRAKTTMAYIRILASAVEQYAAYNPLIGVPFAKNIDELLRALKDKWLIDPDLDFDLSKDAWGNQIVFKRIGGKGSRKFGFISYGADGRPDPAVEGKNDWKWNKDIIFEDGKFVQAPNK